MGRTLEEDLDWLYSLESMGIKLGLSNVRALLGRLGDPQERFSSVHVAGSNGKGSVSAMLASVLRAAGHRTGLYTSPHLVRFSERMTVDGLQPSDAELGRAVSEMRELVEGMKLPRPLTFFEITTALAFLHFADRGADIAVVEVGMGGRLDATNVITPLCCAITPVGLEHTAFLGDTLGRIAYEKASVIKEGVPVVSSPQHPDALRMISWMAACRASPLSVSGRDFHSECLRRDLQGTTVRLSSLCSEVRVGMLGRYQCQNAGVAAECALRLSGFEVAREAVEKGLAEARWPGRLDVVRQRPLTVLDVTHTPEGARAISTELDLFPGSPRVLVAGMLKDKDARGVMAELAPLFDRVICTSPRTPRALSPRGMLEAAVPFNSTATAVDGVPEAIRAAEDLAGPDGFIMVCGSLYTVGEAMQALEEGHGP